MATPNVVRIQHHSVTSCTYSDHPPQRSMNYFPPSRTLRIIGEIAQPNANQALDRMLSQDLIDGLMTPMARRYVGSVDLRATENRRYPTPSLSATIRTLAADSSGASSFSEDPAISARLGALFIHFQISYTVTCQK